MAKGKPYTDQFRYLAFTETVENQLLYTKVWVVTNKLNADGVPLGWIRWFGRWRQYCFFPAEGTLFNNACLQDIITFIEIHKKDRNKPVEVKDGAQESNTA